MEIIQRAPLAPQPAISAFGAPVQRQEDEEEELQMKSDPAALPRQAATAGTPPKGDQNHAENPAGLPDRLRAGLESLAGLDLSAVRVHYNSSRPARFAALAYAQGTEIHMAPGQEKHLPHEGWHVVQQMQRRVQPTIQAKGVAINDDQALESEADAMGAIAQRSGQAEATCCHACAVTVDGGNPGEPRQAAPSPANAQAVAGQRATPETNSVDVPVIQRAAPFTPTPPSPEVNLAKHFIAGYKFTGITVPTLNDTPIFGEADAKKAIKAPTLQEGANPDGTVFAEVGQVPENKGSFVMAVPTNGPWSTLTDKKKASFLFRQVPGAMPPLSCLLPGMTTLTVNGKPTEADFASYALAHETLHAADHQSGFNDVIKAWDDKLQAAQKAVTPFPGATSAAAQAALYKAMEVTPNMGGTPREIATQQHQKWQALNDVLHAAGNTVATGGPATFSNVAADPTCTTSSLDVS